MSLTVSGPIGAETETKTNYITIFPPLAFSELIFSSAIPSNVDIIPGYLEREVSRKSFMPPSVTGRLPKI